ncbi:LOW QUALITY PROTEIN: small ribosomal subunit protein uS3-like, partial [Agelaius tricolor]|uniref:LOW QUALITY PROTEIN: small ribosomal subunit protein uS3-like n=1 Tax=Agelaius tricolor TaxID=9191 RepID=UPI0039F1E09D
PQRLAPSRRGPTAASPDSTAPQRLAPSRSGPTAASPDSTAPQRLAPSRSGPTAASPDSTAPQRLAPSRSGPTAASPDSTAPQRLAPSRSGPTAPLSAPPLAAGSEGPEPRPTGSRAPPRPVLPRVWGRAKILAMACSALVQGADRDTQVLCNVSGCRR